MRDLRQSLCNHSQASSLRVYRCICFICKQAASSVAVPNDSLLAPPRTAAAPGVVASRLRLCQVRIRRCRDVHTPVGPGAGERSRHQAVRTLDTLRQTPCQIRVLNLPESNPHGQDHQISCHWVRLAWTHPCADSCSRHSVMPSRAWPCLAVRPRSPTTYGAHLHSPLSCHTMYWRTPWWECPLGSATRCPQLAYTCVLLCTCDTPLTRVCCCAPATHPFAAELCGTAVSSRINLRWLSTIAGSHEISAGRRQARRLTATAALRVPIKWLARFNWPSASSLFLARLGSFAAPHGFIPYHPSLICCCLLICLQTACGANNGYTGAATQGPAHASPASTGGGNRAVSPCRFFAAGKCNHGSNCRFSHAAPAKRGGGARHQPKKTN